MYTYVCMYVHWKKRMRGNYPMYRYASRVNGRIKHSSKEVFARDGQSSVQNARTLSLGRRWTQLSYLKVVPRVARRVIFSHRSYLIYRYGSFETMLAQLDLDCIKRNVCSYIALVSLMLRLICRNLHCSRTEYNFCVDHGRINKERI